MLESVKDELFMLQCTCIQTDRNSLAVADSAFLCSVLYIHQYHRIVLEDYAIYEEGRVYIVLGLFLIKT